MKNTTPTQASLVVYAKHVARVAAFYERTVGLTLVESDDDFVLLGKNGLELVIVQIPDSIAKQIDLSTPPVIREETPLKFSFLVDDLDQVAVAAADAGGGIKPPEAAWRWRGQLHLDGHDPEGNVVQFRRADA